MPCPASSSRRSSDFASSASCASSSSTVSSKRTVLFVTRGAVPARGDESFGDFGGALERELARGEHGELVDARLRALGDGVERAQRLDLVAEELDTRGL